MTIPFGALISEVARGKSISRILTNSALCEWSEEIRGVVLDLACGANPSYWRVLGLQGQRARLIGVDCNPSCRPAVVADLVHSIPICSESCDVAILSSYLYVPAEPEQILREAWRVLRKGGLLVLTAPLIFPHNPEPTDHWRFTEEGLRCLLSRSRFLIEELTPTGGRWTGAAYLISPFLRPRWLTATVVYWVALKLDFWSDHWYKGLPRCPIAYCVKARKPG